EVQNEVTQKIAASIGSIGTGAVTVADAARARRKPPASLQAYDYYLLGVQSILRHTKDDNLRAKEQFDKAIEADPQSGRAYMKLGCVYDMQAINDGGQGDPAALFEKAKAYFVKAIALDPTDAIAYSGLGEISMNMSDFDRGLAALEQAFALNPNDPDVLVFYG